MSRPGNQAGRPRRFKPPARSLHPKRKPDTSQHCHCRVTVSPATGTCSVLFTTSYNEFSILSRPAASHAQVQEAQHLNDPHAYPRPVLERDNWISLNGDWEFSIDADARWCLPSSVAWNSHIEVPFSPETEASGIGDTGFYKAVWYRRTFDTPPLPDGHRLILHFGAVDYRATVWVNEGLAVEHEGGYTPFAVDITDYLVKPGPQTLAVRAED